MQILSLWLHVSTGKLPQQLCCLKVTNVIIVSFELFDRLRSLERTICFTRALMLTSSLVSIHFLYLLWQISTQLLAFAEIFISRFRSCRSSIKKVHFDLQIFQTATRVWEAGSGSMEIANAPQWHMEPTANIKVTPFFFSELWCLYRVVFYSFWDFKIPNMLT